MPEKTWSFRARFQGNWTTPAVLLGIFLVALYLRAYYPWNLAWPQGLLSGGSDSYYHQWIIEHMVTTGRQLTFDPMLNFPLGLTNPRPPIYQASTAILGMVFSPFFGSVWSSVVFMFLIGTAVWGALTVFPVYFLTKEAFGKRAALLAAFFLAILPAHLQRSPATDADHDAIVLFFVVTAFFFFLKGLRVLNERRWVENWALWTKDGRTSARAGIRAFLSENRATVLYSMMSGWAIAAVALIWQGWAYAPVILLVYFLFQILVHRFRNQDPMGIVIAYGIAVGLPLLVSFPWYWLNNQIKVWYDVPFYLFLLSVGLGLIFAATRDYPWALVLPSVLGFGGLALVIVAIFYPAIGVVFISGAGYFVRTKAYETIAEAQAPALSQIILSFGVATYFMALFGVLWMARGITKRRSADYLFVVVWVVAAIFMAQAAARFIFNASPAFAIASAYVTVLLLDFLRFDEVRKTFRSLGGRPLTAFRRSVKVRHVLGSLLVIVILIPSVWYGVDASIPFEAKSSYDRQVYNAFPDFWKPPGYSQQAGAGGSFFFGAFGYSIPLKSQYYPAAWSWLATQDTDVTVPWQKPAYLSWWDYGFEAVDAGRHPTVADNFLNGYQLAGQFITAPSENDALALLDMRLLQGDYWANGRRFSQPVRETLTSLGVSYAPLEDALGNPDKYVNVVTSDPVKYGDWQDLQPPNAQLIYGRVVLTSALDDHGLAALNYALRAQTGASIRYFAVDTRLFPLDGQNTGIFYAPSKLSDHRIENLADGRSIPTDFFDITATVTGRGTVNIRDLTPTDQVTALSLHYKDAFYNSMFYRAYAGFSPKVVGQNCDDCIPGLQSATNQEIQNIQPMQAWNLKHFRLVYKTAYYNPYPPEQVANHTDAWTAVDYTEAQALQARINSGDATGVVDLSPAATMRRGVVFVKYYDGAFLNGTVSLDGVPWPGVRVTAQDEFGVPHDSAVTDAGGRYGLLLPFGTIRVQASVGTMDNRTMVGPTVVEAFTVAVSDDASMRVNKDANGDGVPDWLLAHNFDVPSQTLDGSVYMDVTRNAKRDPSDPVLGGADLTLSRTDGTLNRTAHADAEGHVEVRGLYAGSYEATVAWQGHTFTLENITISQRQGPMDLAVTPQALQGFVTDPTARGVEGALVALTDTSNGTTMRTTTAVNGSFSFQVLPSGFDVVATKGSSQSLPDHVTVAAGRATTFHNVTVYPSARVSVRSTLGGAALGFATLEFVQRSALHLEQIVTTDAQGLAALSLPEGSWNVHARHYVGAALSAFVGGLTVAAGESRSFTASLVAGATVGGTVYNRDNRTAPLSAAEVLFVGDKGEYRITTDGNGRFFTHLPLGTWTIQVNSLDFTFLMTRTISGNTNLEIAAARGIRIESAVYRSFGAGGQVQIQDPVADAVVTFHNATQSFEVITDAQGKFSVAVPGEGQYALRIARAGYRTYEAPAATPFQWQGTPSFQIVAENVTVSGNLTSNGLPATDPSIPVLFRAQGPGATTAQARLDGFGGYTVNLAPGAYLVVVDRNETGPGDVRLQLQSAIRLTLTVGEGNRSLDLALTIRVKVDGTVSLGGQPRSPVVTFDGPDLLSVNATSGAFTAFVSTGSYTVTANTTEGITPYLAVQALDFGAPATVNLTLLLATNLTGTATHENTSIPAVPLTFARQGGGVLHSVTDSSGAYHILLLGGTYDVTSSHEATATEGGATRYVRYTFSGSVTVAQGTQVQAFRIDLSRTLANTTVSGTVRFGGNGVPGRVAFTAGQTGGMNATATAGSDGRYSIAIQPGSYDVYAVGALDRAAFLGSFTLSAGGPATLDLSLAAAFAVSGVTAFETGGLTAANLTFVSPAGTISTRSDGNGRFLVLLPAATYALDATTVGTERGIAVSYHANTNFALPPSDVKNLELAKVVRRSVEISWNSAEAATIPAGGSIEYVVTVSNTGNVDDTFSLTGSAIGFSFSFNADKVTLRFGPTGNQTMVRVTITAAKDAKVDHGPITIVARSTADATAARSVGVTVNVEQYRGLQATVSSDAPVWDGRFLNYTLEIRNSGNGAATYLLAIRNAEELAAAGWRAAFASSESTLGETSLDLEVDANATQRPILRLEKLGGAAGALARIAVADEQEAQYNALVTVNIQMPALVVDGSVRATGTGISSQSPGLDLATTAFLIAFVAIVAAGAYLAILRRRSR